MVWERRTDVGPTELCFVGLDNDGKAFAYIQDFKDGTSCYWRNLGDVATPAAMDTSRMLASRLAVPISVFAVGEDNTEYLSEKLFFVDERYPAAEAAEHFAIAFQKHIRQHAGVANLGNPAFGAGMPVGVKMKYVKVVTNDGTTLLNLAI
jgi:hypothetical protein